MRWNGTNEDLSNAEIGFFLHYVLIKKHILYERERINASVTDSNERDANY